MFWFWVFFPLKQSFKIILSFYLKKRNIFTCPHLFSVKSKNFQLLIEGLVSSKGSFFKSGNYWALDDQRCATSNMFMLLFSQNDSGRPEILNHSGGDICTRTHTFFNLSIPALEPSFFFFPLTFPYFYSWSCLLQQNQTMFYLESCQR